MYFVAERKPYYRCLFTILKQNSARFAPFYNRVLLTLIEIKGKRSILSQFEERALVRTKYFYTTHLNPFFDISIILLLLDKSDFVYFCFKFPDIK